MASFEDLARPCVRKFSPYVPGRPIEEIKARFGLQRVIKLASNENPLGPSPRALEAIPACLGDLNRYPEGGSTRLRSAIARKWGVEPSCVIVGSGSDELLDLLARTFVGKGDEIVISRHAFIRYRMAGEIMEARVVEVPMVPGLRHDLQAMRKAITARTKVVFIANPNNPTGSFVTRQEFAVFLEGLRQDIIIAMDEAYFEYARHLPEYPDSIGARAGHRGIVSFRTFSKIYGLAGLRTGYAIADPEVILQMDRIRAPFNITIPAQAACEAALQDEAHVLRATELNRSVMEWLCGELVRRGVESIPSATNFLLIRTRKLGVAVFEGLLARGIIVRPMAEYGLQEWIRVTLGTREETELFLKGFLEVEAL